MNWAVFIVGVIAGLGVAAILHGIFDSICDFYKSKEKTRR